MKNSVPIFLHVTGDETGKTYIGEFEVRVRLSHRDELRLDQVRRELLGTSPEHASSDAAARARVFATLRVRLVDYPDWWAASGFGLDLLDENVIVELYEQSIRVANEARQKTLDDGEEAVKVLRKE